MIPQVARLADALGIEASEAAAVVRWLVRNAGEWAPWACERDLAVMLRGPFAALLGEVEDGALAAALVRARIVLRQAQDERDSGYEESSVTGAAQFEPSSWLIGALFAESERKVAARDRKRRRTAERLATAALQQQESSATVAESSATGASPGAESASRVGSVTSPLSSPRPDREALGSTNSPLSTTDERMQFILRLAALYGYGKRSLSPAFTEWLISHLESEPEHGEGDVEAGFRESDGLANRKRYMEAVIGNRVTRRERDERAPPALRQAQGDRFEQEAEADREWQRANGFEVTNEQAGPAPGRTGKVIPWPVNQDA